MDTQSTQGNTGIRQEKYDTNLDVRLNYYYDIVGKQILFPRPGSE